MGEGIDAVLMQGGHPIAFESRKLLPHKRLHSIYDKEMLAIMHDWLSTSSIWWVTGLG